MDCDAGSISAEKRQTDGQVSVQTHVAASDSHSFSQLHLTLRRERDRPYPQYINSNEIKYSVPALSWPSPAQKTLSLPYEEMGKGGERQSPAPCKAEAHTHPRLIVEAGFDYKMDLQLHKE